MDLYASLADVPRQHPFLAALNAVASPLEARCLQTSLHDVASRDALATEWVCAERVLELAIRELRVRRNAVLPTISRVPPEILALVFSHCAQNEYPRASLPLEAVASYHVIYDFNECHGGSHRWDIRSDGQLGWIRLTHVCRSWRAILCSTPELWADCLGVLPLATEEMLRRAGSHLPLRVRAIASYSNGSMGIFADLARVTPSLNLPTICSRIRAVHLLDLRIYSDPPFENYRNVDFENLETLEVIRLYSDEPSDGPVLVTAPRLKSLQLVNSTLRVSSSILVHLSLHWLNSRFFVLTDLLRTLQQVGNTLRTLELVSSIILGPSEDDLDDDDVPPVIDVSLPNLDSLRLDDSDHSMHQFLPRVILPATVKQRLDFFVQPTPHYDWEAETELKQVVQHAVATIHGQPVADGIFIESRNTGRYQKDHDDYLHLHLHRHSARFITSTTALEATTPTLSISIVSSSSPPLLQLALKEVCDLTSTSCVDFVSLKLQRWLAVDLSVVISQFPNMRILRVVNPSRTEIDGSQLLPTLLPASTINNPAATTHLPSSRPYMLDMLWLVEELPISTTFAEWCEKLAIQLRDALSARAKMLGIRGPWMVKALRVQINVRLGDEGEYHCAEHVLKTKFAGLAEEVQRETR